MTKPNLDIEPHWKTRPDAKKIDRLATLIARSLVDDSDIMELGFRRAVLHAADERLAAGLSGPQLR